jgi:hypothetical protein
MQHSSRTLRDLLVLEAGDIRGSAAAELEALERAAPKLRAIQGAFRDQESSLLLATEYQVSFAGHAAPSGAFLLVTTWRSVICGDGHGALELPHVNVVRTRIEPVAAGRGVSVGIDSATAEQSISFRVLSSQMALRVCDAVNQRRPSVEAAELS